MKKYTDKDIKVLDDRQHVRLRTNVYLGSMVPTKFKFPIFDKDTFTIEQYQFVPAVYRAISEVLDNCVDELLQSSPPNPTIKIDCSPSFGMYTISDNGRGVPITKHETGKYTPEVVFGSLRSGRNFNDDRDVGVKGVNGVGVSVVNMCCSEFQIEIIRDGKKYRQKFINGGEQITRPSIRKITTNHTGTSVNFILDDSVFQDVSLPEPVIKHIAKEIAFTHPGFTVELKLPSGKYKFKFKHGIDQLVKQLNVPYHKFTTDNIEFYVIPDLVKSDTEQVFTWANGSLLLDGGICNTQFVNSFTAKFIGFLNSKLTATERKQVKITKDHVRSDLVILGSIQSNELQYDAQAKTRLVGPSIRQTLDHMVDDEWDRFVKKQKSWWSAVLVKAKEILLEHENKKATKQHEKQLKKGVNDPNLTDATSRRRQSCKLIITEGLSAAAMITDIRDPLTIGSYPLTGKINNVWGMTPAQVLKLQKINSLISVIGLTPGKQPDRKTLRYGKIIIATDADYDGGHILSLLVNLFYSFWPTLFDPKNPFIYRLIAPNVIAHKGKQRHYFTSINEFEKVHSKFKSYTIDYIKGLGSLQRDDYAELLSSNQYLLPIVDDGNLKDTLELLFGPDVQARREWLSN